MTTKLSRAEKLNNKDYRKAFVASHINVNIPYQIRALRKQRGWGQQELAYKANMKQAAISRLEKPGNGKTNLDTMIRLANAFDVALIVKFAPYKEVINWSEQFYPDKFQVKSYEQDSIQSQTQSQISIQTFADRLNVSVPNYQAYEGQSGVSGAIELSKLQVAQKYHVPVERVENSYA